MVSLPIAEERRMTMHLALPGICRCLRTNALKRSLLELTKFAASCGRLLITFYSFHIIVRLGMYFMALRLSCFLDGAGRF